MPEGDRGWYTNWWSGGARSPGWERYHLDELIPLIERKFSIRRGRRWHAIAGLSMGGEGAIFYASQRPGYFGSAASFSGVLSVQRPEWPTGFDTQGENHVDVYGDPDAQRFYWTGHNPTALVQNLRLTRLFVAVGDGVRAPGVVETLRQSDSLLSGSGACMVRIRAPNGARFTLKLPFNTLIPQHVRRRHERGRGHRRHKG